MPIARLLLLCVFGSDRFRVGSGDRFSMGSIPFMGGLAFPFIGQGKARVTSEEKRRMRERRRPLGSSGPSCPSFGSRRPCRCQQGQLRVAALSVTNAMRRHRLLVMAFHSIAADVVVS